MCPIAQQNLGGFNVGVLSHNAKVDDVVKMAKFLKASDGLMQRDMLIYSIFGINRDNPEFETYRDRLEKASRATKDANNTIAFQIYSEIFGQDGTIQAVIIKGIPVYCHVPRDKDIEAVTYSPSNTEDVKKLIPLVLAEHKKMPHAEAHEFARLMAGTKGYVMGSIAPTIGALLAEIKTNPDAAKDIDALAETLQIKLQKLKK
ncbi:hypothetical protein D3C78_17800 [compost metagenome]